MFQIFSFLVATGFGLLVTLFSWSLHDEDNLCYGFCSNVASFSHSYTDRDSCVTVPFVPHSLPSMWTIQSSCCSGKTTHKRSTVFFFIRLKLSNIGWFFKISSDPIFPMWWIVFNSYGPTSKWGFCHSYSDREIFLMFLLLNGLLWTGF